MLEAWLVQRFEPEKFPFEKLSAPQTPKILICQILLVANFTSNGFEITVL